MFAMHRRQRQKLLRGFCCFCVVTLAFAVVVSIGNSFRLMGKTKHEASIQLQRFAKILPNWTDEKKRLFSFLSQIQMACQVGKSVGLMEPLPLCLKTRTGRHLRDNFTLISLESQQFDFEVHLRDQWKGAQIAVLSSKTPYGIRPPFIHISTSSDDESAYNQLEKILRQVNSSNVNILKMSNLGNGRGIGPTLLQRIIQNELLADINFLHVFLYLSVDHRLFYDWYLALLSLKLKKDFALYHVSRNLKQCLDNLEKSPCIVSTSWVKEEENVIPLPEMKGSDSDQAKTVLQMLSKNQTNCPSLTIIPARYNISSIDKSDNLNPSLRSQNWPLCIWQMTLPCTVYTAKYGTSKDYENVLIGFGCNVHTFDPTLPHSNTFDPVKPIFHHPWGFAQMNNSIQYQVGSDLQTWYFRKPSDTIQELGHENVTIDVLHLDMHGGEWEVFQELLSSNKMRNVRQIVATVHVWYGEEFFIHIGEFIALQRMKALGFQIYFVQPMMDSYNTANTIGCCFTVGWLKTKSHLN